MSDTNDQGDSYKSKDRRKEVVAAIPSAASQPSASKSDRENQRNADPMWERSHSRVTLFFNFLLLILGGVGTAFVYDQIKLTRASNELTQESNELTRQAVCQARQDRLDDDDAAAQSREDAAWVANATLDKMQAGNDLTRNVYLDSTRPWIGMTAINGPADDKGAPAFISDQSFRVNIWYKNFGQSPAIGVRPRAKCLIVPREPFPHIDYDLSDQGDDIVRAQTVFPGDTKYTSRAQAVTVKNLQRLTDLTDVFIVYGVLDYTDTAGRNHHTPFCRKVFLNGSLGTCANKPAPN